MNKYINIYNIGFEEGIYFAYKDILENKKRIFIDINDIFLKSKIYDLGYIDGYNTFYKIMENHL